MLPDFHVGPDGEKYVTRAQAAKIKGVALGTIDGWIRKGYLASIPGCPPRHQMFKLADVDRAETTAYLAALRTSGSGRRVERRLEDAA